MEMMLKPLLLLLLGSSVPVMAYPGGAPEDVCSTLTPGVRPHSGFGQNSPSPYSITFSPANYTAGGTPITVNLTGLCGNVFRGFLIQARRADTAQNTAQNTAEIIGSFAAVSGTRVACTSGLTHNSRTDKTVLSLTWTPPSASAGHVHFRVTFMQQTTAWWGNVKSAVLRDSAVPGTPSTLETASTTIDPTCPTTTAAQTMQPTSTSQTTVESPNTTLSLGSTAGMNTSPMGSTAVMNSSETAESSTTAGSVAGQTTSAPMTITNTAASSNTIASTTDAASTASSQGISNAGCGTTKGCYTDCNGGSCSFVVSWTPDVDSIIFEIQARNVLSGDSYMSIGFSDDARMGSDPVSDCKYIGGRMTVTQSFNEGRSGSPQIATNSLNLLSGGVQDGIFNCRFRQPKMPSGSQQPNLNNPFYILFAQGVVSSAGVKSQHRDRYAATAPASLTAVGNVGAGSGGESVALVKAHGCMMTIAWLFCASVGILIARHFKGLLPGRKVAGTDIWFQLHRTLMVLTFALCIAAFVIIFIYAKDWSGDTGISYRDAHPYLGVIVTFFVIVNPIMALFRPHPGTENRYIFNWAHWGVGTTAHILAVVTIYIGTRMGQPNIPDFVIYFVVAFTVVHVLVYVFLEIIKWSAGKSVAVTPQHSGPSVASMLDEDRSDSYELQQVGANQKKTSSSSNSTLEFVKLALFWFHFLVAMAMTIVIVVYIAIA